MKRGEIRWYRFKAPDKRRPVVILTRDSVLDYLGEVTVAPITSTIREIPSEVLVGPEDGVPRNCAINLDHVQTVSKDQLGGIVATLPEARMDEVRDAPCSPSGIDRPTARTLSSATLRETPRDSAASHQYDKKNRSPDRGAHHRRRHPGPRRQRFRAT
jgi:mRNA interferase MazF